MIVIAQQPLPDTRTAENSCVYVAECEIEGRRFVARSRRGAPAELARILVAAGVADQPVEVRQADLPGGIGYASLHKMAAHTFEEGDRPLRRVQYRATSDRGAFGVERRQNRGEAPEPAHLLSGGALPAISPHLRWPMPEAAGGETPAVPAWSRAVFRGTAGLGRVAAQFTARLFGRNTV